LDSGNHQADPTVQMTRFEKRFLFSLDSIFLMRG
jgi:hypothetical protein